jgi:hypothetical protein
MSYKEEVIMETNQQHGICVQCGYPGAAGHCLGERLCDVCMSILQSLYRHKMYWEQAGEDIARERRRLLEGR